MPQRPSASSRSSVLPAQELANGSQNPIHQAPLKPALLRFCNSWWLAVFLLLTAVAVAYANIGSADFVFDGRLFILSYKPVRALWPPEYFWSSTRPVVFFTFALNYALSGEQIWSYQVVNLCIHLLNTLLVYALTRLIIERSPYSDPRMISDSWCISLCTAALWALHPLQTQGVTYTYQRLESLTSLWYLASLVGFVLAATSRKKILILGTILCLLLGMASKELMATAPLLILWLDRVFFAKSVRDVVQTRWKLHLCIWSTLIFLFGIMWAHRENYDDGGIGVIQKGTPWQYLITQPSVIFQYLKLLFWPDGQALDPCWPWRMSLSEAWPEVLPFALGLCLIVFLMVRFPRTGFLAGGWLLVLAPTSSIVPIADAYFEHRMYLPIAFLTAGFVLAIYQLARLATDTLKLPQQSPAGISLLVCVPVAMALGCVTYSRNTIYTSEVAAFMDTIQKYPDAARPRSSLVRNYLADNRLEKAATHAAYLVRNYSRSAESYADFGLVLLAMKIPEDAAVMFRKAHELDPKNSLHLLNLGDALVEVNPQEAVVELQKSAALKRDHVDTWYNLGRAYVRLNDLPKAEAALREGLTIPGPNFATRELLADVLLATGRREEAIDILNSLLQNRPESREILNKLQQATTSP